MPVPKPRRTWITWVLGVLVIALAGAILYPALMPGWTPDIQARSNLVTCITTLASSYNVEEQDQRTLEFQFVSALGDMKNPFDAAKPGYEPRIGVRSGSTQEQLMALVEAQATERGRVVMLIQYPLPPNKGEATAVPGWIVAAVRVKRVQGNGKDIITKSSRL
jgi:hypothetical protein